MRQKGFTLLEMTLSVAILGVIAVVAMPNLAPLHGEKLDLAANLVADAIRYARHEAIRSGEIHGVSISQVTQRVQVAKYDTTTTSSVLLVAVLTNPLSKQPYMIDFDILSSTRGVRVSNSQDIFFYSDSNRRRRVLFDANGTPQWIKPPVPVDNYLLVDAGVQLTSGAEQRLVRIAPYTGRVTIE